MQKLVVTRHMALLKYLVKAGLVEEGTPHVTRANIADVKGKHVFGVLPYWLACHAEKVTDIQLSLSPAQRAQELTLEEVEFHASKPQTYIVRKES